MVHERAQLELVAGVDIDPDKVGRDVGSIIGLKKPLGVKAVRSIGELGDHFEADIVLHTTNSFFPEFEPQILAILDAGFDVVSTSEELSFPWGSHSEGAVELDSAAKKAGKTVLGTGVNPGFLMDWLPLSLTAICQRVDHIDVKRVINASTRRGPFQLKIGAGLSVEEFKARISAGTMGHIGLRESAGMVFHAFGKELAGFQSSVEPITTDQKKETPYILAQPGQVIGIMQDASASTEDGEFLKLTFVAALDAREEQDTITISGKPNLEVRLRGTNGDFATAAIAVNAIPRVLEANPGLVTMYDLPTPACWEWPSTKLHISPDMGRPV